MASFFLYLTFSIDYFKNLLKKQKDNHPTTDIWNFSLLFHFKYFRNGPTETASDSLKIDITKKLISQELKHIYVIYLVIYHLAVKSTGKLKYFYSTITLLLASYKQSFSISHQISPFSQIFAQVFLKYHFHVFPKNSNPYIDGICV